MQAFDLFIYLKIVFFFSFSPGRLSSPVSASAGLNQVTQLKERAWQITEWEKATVWTLLRVSSPPVQASLLLETQLELTL